MSKVLLTIIEISVRSISCNLDWIQFVYRPKNFNLQAYKQTEIVLDNGVDETWSVFPSLLTREIGCG